MMDVLIFMAGGVTAVFIAWLVQPIFGGLIEGMNGGTSRRKKRSEEQLVPHVGRCLHTAFLRHGRCTALVAVALGVPDERSRINARELGQ